MVVISSSEFLAMSNWSKFYNYMWFVNNLKPVYGTTKKFTECIAMVGGWNKFDSDYAFLKQ